MLSPLLIADKAVNNQHLKLEDRYYPHIHSPFQHKYIKNGMNLYFAERYTDTVTPADNVYYWLQHIKHRSHPTPLIYKDRSSYRLVLLLLSGIEQNPGPRRPRFPCGICTKACKDKVIACDDCDTWIHKSCLGMTTEEFDKLGNSEATWSCPSCAKPNNSSTILYHVPDSTTNNMNNNASVNLSTQPSRLDSISDASIPSTSGSSLGSHSSSIMFSPTSIAGSPIMTSSPKPNNATNTPAQTKRTRKSLRILNINFQSLRKKGKLLESILETTDADIVLGTETWLDTNIKSSEIFPPYLNLDVERRDRPSDPHGGVLIAAKRELQLGNIIKSDSLELISGTIKLEGQKRMRVASYYRPPTQVDDQSTDKYKEEITTLRNRRKNDIFLIGGDYNLPDINWKDHTIQSNQYPLKVNRAYIDAVADNGLEQIVDFPTRGDNTLDLILTTHPSFKHRCKPIPSIGNSDHDIVLLDVACKATRPKPPRRKILLWKKADINKIQEDIATYGNTFMEKSFDNINSMWTDFKDKIHSIMEHRVPTKTTKPRHSNPWINTRIRRKITQKNRAHSKARKTRKKRDKDRYKRLQREVQWEVRKANKEYMTDVICDKDNTKKFWSYIKSKGQEFIGVAPLKDKDGFLHSDNQSKANILNDQFKSVFTKEDHTNLPDKGRSPFNTMEQINISERGVLKLLKTQKPHKATGPDDIPAFILRSAANQLAPILTRIYQYSLEAGEVPQDWRDALVVPIYKKGERHIAANYRPVSLTSISCKILEHIIHSSIMKHLDANKILTDAQHGFRNRRSCETQLIVSVQEIARRLAKGLQVDIILLDFAKAFDKVPHSRLLHKLTYYGVNIKTINWVRSFLENRKQNVVLEGATSTSAPVMSGVPQGSVLGPLLFLAYINDMPDIITHSETRLFADDTILFRTITSIEDHKLLQEDLTALETWENTWQMAFNPTKCTVIRVTSGKSKPILNTQYQLHGHTLEIEDASKYLGVTLTSNLSWDRHVDNVVAKGNRTLGFIRRNLKDCPKPVREASYTTIVRPTLEYASTVWDPTSQNKIKALENVQRRAARFVTKDYTSRTPGCVTYMVNSLGWQSLEQRRKNSRLYMLYKIQHNLVDINRNLYIRSNDSRTRGPHKLFQERTTNTIYRNSFFLRTVVDWNHLPVAAAAATSIEEFRANLGVSPASY